MQSARAGVLLSALVFLSSVAVAHAQGDFVVTETQARAGDAVHFAITGTSGRVEYELEVGDEDVLRGSATGNPIAGEFAMPDLGGKARPVKVEAEWRVSGKRKKVKHTLEYLGLALPPAKAEPAPESAPAPAPAVATPNAVLSPSPAPVAVPAPAAAPVTPKASGTGASPARAVRRGRRRTAPIAHRGRNRVERRGRAEGRTGERRRGQRGKRSRRLRARTAPLFDGVPEPGSGRYRESSPSGFAALNAIVSPTTAARSADAGLPVAILVPGMLGLAAIALSGMALHRRRVLNRR